MPFSVQLSEDSEDDEAASAGQPEYCYVRESSTATYLCLPLPHGPSQGDPCALLEDDPADMWAITEKADRQLPCTVHCGMTFALVFLVTTRRVRRKKIKNPRQLRGVALTSAGRASSSLPALKVHLHEIFLVRFIALIKHT
jgi:hypothetical protein